MAQEEKIAEASWCKLRQAGPRGTMELYEPRHLFGLFVYLITCFIIIALGEAMQVAQPPRF